ncbi:hypothetical protein L5876_08830 [Hyphobacterium sp. SN044]|uniref:tetratricopeptide repeat protein n=1 Tax=Hyphobacterium sp. SN044 TaxID=2912575 RepID=UPI001F3050AD|nr:hypothetical protein [Hyphobacterium sp. SN044]MCF8879915.1 hypothetical protein [Hyphobacterium sp. SN044]
MRQFFARLIRFAKRIMYRFSAFVFGLLFKIIPPRRVQPVVQVFAHVLPLGIVSAAWRRILYAAHYRFVACEWSEWAYERHKRPHTTIALLQDLLATKQFARAAEVVEEARRILLSKPKWEGFSKNLDDYQTILMIETEGFRPEMEGALIGRSIIADYFYKRAWDWHSMMAKAPLVQAVEIYFIAMNYEPAAVVYGCEVLLKPHELWNYIERFIGRSEQVHKLRSARDTRMSRRRRVRKDLARLSALEVNALILSGRMDEAAHRLKEASATDLDLLPVRALFESIQGNHAEAIARMNDALYATETSPETQNMIAEALFFMGVEIEESRDFALAREYYRRAVGIVGIKSYMPESAYRYFSLAAGLGNWDEALFILRQAHFSIWRNFARFAKRMKIHMRIKRKRLIPQYSTLFLGGQGVGDEIMRLAILKQTANPKAQYGYVCDKRVASLFERSMDNLTVYSTSRLFGPFAVSEDQYWLDREGTPLDADPGRITRDILDAMEEYSEIAISEDLFLHYVMQKGSYRGDKAPLFKAAPAARTKVAKWLKTLPPAKLNVGISWRSGTRDLFRSKAYTDILQWGDILKTKDVNFVLLQYSDCTQELAEVKEKFGVDIHVMPGVDLKDDFEEVVALCEKLDLVLTPGVALRETAGASGANTWSLTTTPHLPDWWRIASEDNETDTLFPSMKHITAREYGGRQQVLDEIARRLKILTQQKKKAA